LIAKELGMRKTGNTIRNEKGFTMVEIVLYIVLSGILFNIAAQTLMGQINSYSFVAERKATMSDARYAINRISYDMMRIDPENITELDSDNISFTDFEGDATSYSFDPDTGILSKGAEHLLDSVQNFTIVAYDSSGTETEVIADARQFKFTITTAPKNNEGSMTLTTTIMPRSFMYAGYE
jgi:type II secretory pathway pseudopilin PulG